MDKYDLWERRDALSRRADMGESGLAAAQLALALDPEAPEQERAGAALFALGRGEPGAEALTPLLSDPQAPPDLRLAVLVAMDDRPSLADPAAARAVFEDRTAPDEHVEAAADLLSRDPSEDWRARAEALLADASARPVQRFAALRCMGRFFGDRHADALLAVVQNPAESEKLRAEALRVHPGPFDPALLERLHAEGTFPLQRTVLEVSARMPAAEAGRLLSALAQSPRLADYERSSVFEAMAEHGDDDAMRARLFARLAEGGYNGEPPRLQFTAPMDWRGAADEILAALQASRKARHEIDAAAAVAFIADARRPPGDRWGDRVAEGIEEFLIERALNAPPKMVGVLAAMLQAGAGGRRDKVADLIRRYEEEHGVAADALKPLRIEIGGSEALEPVVEVLQRNLEENFEAPISELNATTKSMWEDTIRSAQFGFKARMWMSIGIFVVGTALLIASASRVVLADDLSNLGGPLVSLAIGLGMMVFVVYRGPLREIRQSVNDLGTASAAFIAYVHRVLEISHTFSFYYLNNRIDFAAMERSSALIRDAMRETVALLEKDYDIRGEAGAYQLRPPSPAGQAPAPPAAAAPAADPFDDPFAPPPPPPTPARLRA